RYIMLLLSVLLFACGSPAPEKKKEVSVTKPAKPKILFVCSNISAVDGKPNGTFLSEIAVPFIKFQEAGYLIDVVSPLGGKVPVYYKFDTTEVIARALESKYYQQKIANSMKPQQIRPKEYGAVIIPGGYSQFWDVQIDEPIKGIIAQVHEQGGVVGSLGHGTSSLVNVLLSSGKYLVQGKTMTCFPSWFEKEVMTEADYGKLLPFDMEEGLRMRGANLKPAQKGSIDDSEVVDEEHRIVTASMATSGDFIFNQIHRLLNSNE
ncbi:MAG: type 1 glutamine amidotransferase domain-containing protein, partial [Bacteroidia bacterium]